MGVSATGQGVRASAIRTALATALVFLAVFYYFYGPPLTHALRDAAERECNRITGSTYRDYVLVWETTTYRSVAVPHWQCYERGEPTSTSTNLGWWVGT